MVTASSTGVATVYATAGNRRLAVIHEPRAGGEGSQNFSIAGNGLSAAVLSRDGRYVPRPAATRPRAYGTRPPAAIAVFSAPRTQALNDVAFNADASQLVTADDGGRAVIFQPGGSHPVRTVTEPGGGPLVTAVFSPDVTSC